MASEEKIIRNVGVDFGTSTSAVFYKDYHEDGSPVKQADEGTPVKFELTHNTLPTLIFDDQNGNTYFGHEAERRSRSKPEGLKSAFKIDLVSEDPETVQRATELTERFLGHLYLEYKSQSTVPHGVKLEERTLVSYPAKWPDEARKATLEAARKAGFPNVKGKEEPSAAMLYFLNVRTSAVEEAMRELRKRGVIVEGKPVTALLIDMGAGTTDFVLYRYTPGTNEYEFLPPVWPPVGHEGFGGREVDELLWERILDPVVRSGAENLGLPYEVLAKRFRRTAKAWKEEEVSPILRDDGQVEQFPPDLSLMAGMGPELGLDRKRFREEVAEYLEHFPRLLRELVEHAVEKGSIESGKDVELVVLTGGHSQWHFINEMLTASESPLGMVRGESYRLVRGPHPQETVARGLAMTAPISRSSNSAWLRIGTKTDHETMKIHGRGTKLPLKKWIMKEHNFCRASNAEQGQCMLSVGDSVDQAEEIGKSDFPLPGSHYKIREFDIDLMLLTNLRPGYIINDLLVTLEIDVDDEEEYSVLGEVKETPHYTRKELDSRFFVINRESPSPKERELHEVKGAPYLALTVPEELLGRKRGRIRVNKWLKEPGDYIRKGEQYVEIEQEGYGAINLSSPLEGLLYEIRAHEGEHPYWNWNKAELGTIKGPRWKLPRP